MDGRLLALGMALLVTLIGVVTIFATMQPVDTESDYTLLDEVAEGEIEPGLTYEYTRSSDLYSRDLKITVSKVETYAIAAMKSDHQRFNGGTWTFDDFDPQYMLFDYTDPADVPDGITVTVEEAGDTTCYTINGTGTIDSEVIHVFKKHIECTFTDLVITEYNPSPACLGMDGTVAINGMVMNEVPGNTTEYKDMVLTYSSDSVPGVCSVTGEFNRDGIYAYITGDDLMEDMIKFDPSTTVVQKIDEVMYASIPCYRYTLSGDDGINVYKGYVSIIHKSFVVKSDGTMNGEKVTERMDIYYKNEQ